MTDVGECGTLAIVERGKDADGRTYKTDTVWLRGLPGGWPLCRIKLGELCVVLGHQANVQHKHGFDATYLPVIVGCRF